MYVPKDTLSNKTQNQSSFSKISQNKKQAQQGNLYNFSGKLHRCIPNLFMFHWKPN